MIDLYNKILLYYNSITNQILHMEFVEVMKGFNEEESLLLFNLNQNIKDNSTKVAFLDQEDYPDLFIDNLTSIIEYSPELKKLIIHYEMQEGGGVSSERFYWNNHNPQRQYSQEEVLNIYYNDYLNCNLKNVLKSNNNIYIEFLPLDKLLLNENTLVKDWDGCFQDPFLDEFNSNKIALGQSILEKGTYFPCMVFLDYDLEHYHIREGNHRIASLKLCQLRGLVPDDYKICCIVLPRDLGLNMRDSIYNHNLTDKIKSRYILECFWTPRVINDEDYLKIVKENLIKQNHQLLNDYVVEYEVTSYVGLYEAVHAFPLFLRDLFYHYPEIKPATIINDEKEFQKWLKEE